MSFVVIGSCGGGGSDGSCIGGDFAVGLGVAGSSSSSSMMSSPTMVMRRIGDTDPLAREPAPGR